jgi:hypothetical protein
MGCVRTPILPSRGTFSADGQLFKGLSARWIEAKSGCRGIRAGQPDDPMARTHELEDGGGADPAGCAGNEDRHEQDLQLSGAPGRAVEHATYPTDAFPDA